MHAPPPEARPWPDLLLPPGPAELSALRQAAEAAGDDARLLALRELELAVEALPPVIDGVRRSRLLAVDALTSTWEGWRTDDGARVLLRCLRARWAQDPVMRRRLAAAPALLQPVEARLGEGWPHLRCPAPGSPLVDRLPVEDPPDTACLARLLGAGLEGLARLHAAGRVHGGPLGALLVDGPTGARLHWLDPFDPARSPSEDLQALGATVAALDPQGEDPVGQLALAWAQQPPPSALDGQALLQACLRGLLLSQRHRFVLSWRRVGRRDRATRLAQAGRALARALPPPAVHACLAAPEGLLVMAWSDGRELRGGLGAGADPQRLARIWSVEGGLDAQAARGLLRAWATRAQGDEDRRAAVQAQLGADAARTEGLMRWLRAMAELRRAGLWNAHVARG